MPQKKIEPEKTTGRMTREKLERLAELRAKSWSLEAISADLGLSVGAVSYHALKHGIEAPKAKSAVLPQTYIGPTVVRRGNRTVRHFTPDEDAKLLELRAQDLSYSEIGRRLGRRHNTVQYRLMALARHEARRDAANGEI